MTDGVVIVGGGASGTLTALALAGVPGLGPLTLVDTGGAFARGVAYSTEEPVHLLNVPAGRMSAFPDQPSHLLAWLAARGERGGPGGLPPAAAVRRVPRRAARRDGGAGAPAHGAGRSRSPPTAGGSG